MKFRQLLTKRNLKTGILAFFVIVIIGMFPLRSLILRKTIASVNTRLNYSGYTANWNGIKFKGLRTVFIEEANIKSKKNNDEAALESLSISVRIMPLFLKHVRIKEINCNNILIQRSADDTVMHESQKIKSSDERSLYNLNMAEFSHKNIRRFFNYLPSKINLKRIQLKYTYAGITSIIKLNDLRLNRNGELTAGMIFSDYKTSLTIPLSGRLDKGASLVDLNLLNPSGSFLPVPFLLDKYGISTGFDSLKIFLDLSDRNRQMVKLNGRFSFSGFELNSKRISTETIKINHFSSSVRMKIADSFIEIDSSSSGYLNEIKINPWLRIAIRPEPEISFKILPQTWQSDKFFRSLPEGMFTSVRGIHSEGTLNYFLNFFINLNNPDSLFFNTQLTSGNFRILSYGADDYRILNNSFQHKVYEKGRLMASFTVGPENPDFVAFSEISPYLRYAVMTSEDGSFFYHNGFNPGAFRESMVTNIKEKRFARGGSTITMQLVKNVFLTRNKTLARKIEEALIVWMIENKNLVSKERMYEVYLNIIEWGPGIYGINQASHYYFDKKPSELTLNESIYLASIVPHPKWYKYSFVSNGELKPFYSNYFNRMRELMVRKQFIAPYDTLGVKQDVLLTGNASIVFASDTTIMDSIIMDLLYIAPEF